MEVLWWLHFAIISLLYATAIDTSSALVHIAGRSSSGTHPGFSDCPCVDTENNATWAQIARRYEIVRDGKTVLRDTGFNEFSRAFASDEEIVPRNYGSRVCDTWDKGNARCSDNGVELPSAPAWCKQSWCYVDSQNCRNRYPSRSFLFPGMFWSYETCGNVRWTKLTGVLYFETISELPHVRLGYPESGWPSAAGPTGRRDLIEANEFINEVLGFLQTSPSKIQRLNVSALSKEVFPASSYTACTHDVALGSKELCVGAFWVTPDRTLLTSFAPPIYSDLFYLYVRSRQPQFDLATITRPFQPFCWTLWVVIIFLTIVSGLAVAFLEGRFMSQRRSNLAYSCRYSYWASISMLSAAIPYAPKTPQGKVLSLGFAFLVLMCIASFTANTTSFLLEFDLSHEIKNMEEARLNKIPICVYGSTFIPLSAKYPGVKMISLGDNQIIAERFLAKECKAIILTESLFSEAIVKGWDGGSFCQSGLVTVGQPLLTLDVSFPISRTILASFSWAIVNAKADAVLGKNLGENPYSEADASCPKLNPSDLDTDTHSLEPKDLAGVFLVYGISLAMAFGMYFIGFGRTTSAERPDLESLSDVDTSESDKF